MRLRLVILVVAVLSGCTPRGAIVMLPEGVQPQETQTVFIGTTRGPDPETGEPFGKTRQTEARFARLVVAIPPEREPGQVEWPRPGRPLDARREFAAVEEAVYPGRAAFRADLARAFRARRRGEREAMIFVHGFNNTFAEGAYRQAQLAEDLKISAVLVHYSWPSIAHPLGYAYDRDSALFARDGLEALLREVVAAGAERVLIVAHSLGSALTMEALRQMAIAGDSPLRPDRTGVVLISPDIDVDVFRAQAARIGALPRPFLILASKRDRILSLSARISGQRNRLGNVTDAQRLADLKVTLIDTTAFSRGVGHFDAATSPSLLAILGGIGSVDSAFRGDNAVRTGLFPGVALTVQNATEIILRPISGM
ncbi:alpha/beta hydrolase [Albidovulum sp.]